MSSGAGIGAWPNDEDEEPDTIPMPAVARDRAFEEYPHTPKLRVFNPSVELHEHIAETAATAKDNFRQGVAAGLAIGFVLGALIF